jgi:hypothetical protein
MDKKAEIILKQQQIAVWEQKKRILEGLPHRHRFKWYKWAKAFYESKNKINLLTAANQISKMLCVNTIIPTPTGFKKMGELCIGDYIFGQDGSPTKVIDIPFLGEEDCYEFVFSDNTSIIAGKDHLWFSKGYKERFRKKYFVNRGKNKGKVFDNSEYNKWNIYSTKEILKLGGYCPEASPTKKFVIPITQAVKYSEKTFPLNPYFLGILLGNGSITKSVSVTLNKNDSDIAAFLVKQGGHIVKAKRKITSVHFSREFLLRCIELGLNKYSHEKEIPIQYLLGSEQQRKELLAGLLDTDGTVSKTGQNYSFCSTSYKLIKQTEFLVCSLGGICQIQNRGRGYYINEAKEKVLCKEFYVLTIWTTFNPFLSKRKAAKWKINSRYKHERVINKIIPLGKRRAKCITVDNSDGSFLATKNFIVTHNSSTMIRKCIEWAGNPVLWPALWKSEPRQFWYLYPTKDVATIEFLTKWEPEFMPRNEFKGHSTFGWSIEKDKRQIHHIKFNSGVYVFFKSYKQDVAALQSGSCHALFVDEELNVELYDELIMRLSAGNIDGYFHSVFTATLGQEFWRCAMEERSEKETLKHAFKQQISMYDCMFYEDGSPGPYDEDRIARIKANCKSEEEIQRRIYGRFVVDTGKIYNAFSREQNVIPPLWSSPPEDWHVYTGVDPGGGGRGHPAAMCFVAIRPDYRFGAVFRGWKGNSKEDTTSSDILLKYKLMRADTKPVLQSYDWAAKDFLIYASRLGEAFTPAEKGHDVGEDTLNILFKNKMLAIFDIEELHPMIDEFNTLNRNTDKCHAHDDFVDSLRYAITSRVNWDWSVINEEKKPAKVDQNDKSDEERRKEWGEVEEYKYDIESEIEEWNDLYG